jgi:hypothetical protein
MKSLLSSLVPKIGYEMDKILAGKSVQQKLDCTVLFLGQEYPNTCEQY